MILEPGHYAARQFGVGRTNSGPSGRAAKPARVNARARGDQYIMARRSWVWQLYANPSNLHHGAFAKADAS